MRYSPRTRRDRLCVWWCSAVAVWSVVFAVPHLYWAAGGRAGLGAQAAVADRALAEPWFATYNLLTGVLAVAGALLASTLAIRWGRTPPRPLLILVGLAGVVLLARGLVGVTLLAVDGLDGGPDGEIPLLLLAVEPWFVLGGIAYLGMAVALRRATRPSRDIQP